MTITLMTRTFQIEVTAPHADIHELLCLAIHEKDLDALDKLCDCVTNISEVENEA